MKKLCHLLALMLLLLVSSQAFAAGDESFLGTWYGYDSGTPMSWRFEKKGVAYLHPLGSQKEYKLKYTVKENSIHTKWNKWEFEFQIGENELIAVYSDHYNDPSLPDGRFTREPFEAVFPSREKLKGASPEQFSGIWKLRYLVWRDSQYMKDAEHDGAGSFWSVNPDPATGIYFIRIDAENSRVELLDAGKNVLETHPLKWKKNGTFADTFWNNTYTLITDGTLEIENKPATMHLYREDR